MAGLALGSQLLGIVALALWAIAVASDYQTGLIGLLVQAEPSRIRLLAGKVVALVLLTLVGALVATLAAVGAAYVMASVLDISNGAWTQGMATTILEAFRNLAMSTIVWGIIGLTDSNAHPQRGRIDSRRHRLGGGVRDHAAGSGLGRC